VNPRIRPCSGGRHVPSRRHSRWSGLRGRVRRSTRSSLRSSAARNCAPRAAVPPPAVGEALREICGRSPRWPPRNPPSLAALSQGTPVGAKGLLWGSMPR
jgi:hypothetical protein